MTRNNTFATPSTHPASPPLTPIPRVNKAPAPDGFPRFRFTPERGALYKRRIGRLANRHADSASPLQRDESLCSAPALDYSRSSRHGTDSIHGSDVPPATFYIFRCLLNHPELMFEVSKHFTINSLVNLYATSKDFHHLVNSRFTALVTGYAQTQAHETSRIFRFKCYGDLCQHDPMLRASNVKENEVRDVPSFRWLRMILFRERIVNEIILNLAKAGIGLPRYVTAAMKKLWFTMDIADNSRRVGLIHNKQFWTNRDLFMVTLFLIKLDMRLTDPVDGNGETGLRQMILSQRSLSFMHAVLYRRKLRNQYEMMQALVAWKYVPPPRDRGIDIMGVPACWVGRGQFEGWGRGTRVLMRPDQLIMREAARRGMKLENQYLDMMLWGFVDRKTHEDIWPMQGIKDDGRIWGGDSDNEEWNSEDGTDSEEESSDEEGDESGIEKDKEDGQEDDDDSGDELEDEDHAESDCERNGKAR